VILNIIAYIASNYNDKAVRKIFDNLACSYSQFRIDYLAALSARSIPEGKDLPIKSTPSRPYSISLSLLRRPSTNRGEYQDSIDI
jgi:hypothetical protein